MHYKDPMKKGDCWDVIFVEIESLESAIMGFFWMIETFVRLVLSLSAQVSCANGGILKFVLKRELHEKEGFYLLC